MHGPSFMIGALAGMLAMWAARMFRQHRASLLAERNQRAKRELGNVFELRDTRRPVRG